MGLHLIGRRVSSRTFIELEVPSPVFGLGS